MMRLRLRLTAWIVAGALLASPPARAGGADPTLANAVQKQQAQTDFAKARAAFEQKQYADALEAAKASWDVVASPNARIFVARCLRELGRYTDAYSEYSATIADARALATKEPRYDDTARAAADERAGIEPNVALLTIEVDQPIEDTQLFVAGQPVPRASWNTPLPENPGAVDVVAQAGGKEVDRRRVTLSVGKAQTISMEGFAPPPATAPATAPADVTPAGEAPEAAGTEPAPANQEEEQRLRTVAYAFGGAGVAGMVVFGVFTALAPSTSSGQQTTSRAKAYEFVSYMGLGIGIAGIGAGASLFLLNLPGGSSKPSKPVSPRTTFLVLSPMFVGVRGTL